MEEVSALQKFINTVIEYAVNYGFQALGAVIILIFGAFAASWTGALLNKTLQKNKVDVTLAGFLAGLARVVVLVFAVLIALGNFGVTIAPFIAAISAMAFGASFAIQGPLSNYGAGLSLILSRPFVVGNTITVAEQTGVVQDIKLACTILKNEDGVIITIPNKDVVGKILHNSKEHKLINAVFGISYESSHEKAIEIIRQTLRKFPTVVQKPEAQVGIESFGDSALNIACRFWAPTVEYYAVLFAFNKAVYEAFSQAGIVIPYPQREIRIISQRVSANK